MPDTYPCQPPPPLHDPARVAEDAPLLPTTGRPALVRRWHRDIGGRRGSHRALLGGGNGRTHRNGRSHRDGR